MTRPPNPTERNLYRMACPVSGCTEMRERADGKESGGDPYAHLARWLESHLLGSH